MITKTSSIYLSIALIFALAIVGYFTTGPKFDSFIKDAFYHPKRSVPTIQQVEPPTQFSLPQIVVSSSINGESLLTILKYDQSLKKYIADKDFKSDEPIVSLGVIEDKIYVQTDKSIGRFSTDLVKEKEVSFDRTGGVLAALDRYIFVSSGERFTSFDEDLNQLDSVDVNLGEGEVAHDVLLYDNKAYLLAYRLGDELIDRYVYSIDVNNPTDMNIEYAMASFSSVPYTNPTLDFQWLNPEMNQWVVIESNGELMGGKSSGGRQSADIFPISDNRAIEAKLQDFLDSEFPVLFADNKAVGATELYNTLDKQGNVPYIMAVTPVPPIWAILRQATYDPEGMMYYLAQISSEGNNVSFARLFSLGKSDSDKYPNNFTDIMYYDQYLFIVINESTIVVDVGQSPKILIQQELPGFAVSNFGFLAR